MEKPQKAQITMNDPYEGVRQGWRTHFVHVPGVLFMMALGKNVDDSVRALSITNAGNPINLSDALTENVERLMVETFQNSHKTGIPPCKSKSRRGEKEAVLAVGESPFHSMLRGFECNGLIASSESTSTSARLTRCGRR